MCVPAARRRGETRGADIFFGKRIPWERRGKERARVESFVKSFGIIGARCDNRGE